MPTRVLIIEDDAGTIRLFTTIIQRRFPKITIISTQGGPEALTLLEKGPFELILLDLALPGIDGIEILDYIHRLPQQKQARVLVVTAHHILARKAQQLGVDELLIKPVRPGQLAETIARLI